MFVECSRNFQTAFAIIGRQLRPHEHLHCLPDGRFDRLQCLAGSCLCVDDQDGKSDSVKPILVNASLISRDTLTCCKFALIKLDGDLT